MNGTVTERNPGFIASEIQGRPFRSEPVSLLQPSLGRRPRGWPLSDRLLAHRRSDRLRGYHGGPLDAHDQPSRPYASARLPLTISAIVVLAVAAGRHRAQPIQSVSSPRRWWEDNPSRLSSRPARSASARPGLPGSRGAGRISPSITGTPR